MTRAYPLIVTVINGGAHWLHPVIDVTYKEGDETHQFCGDSWCHGSCKLPALIIPAHGKSPELKMCSSVVALGNVMQPWRLAWEGEKIEIPDKYKDYFRKRIWI